MDKQDFIQLIRQCIHSKFTGKIHIAYRSNRQFVGEVMFNRGKCFYARYQQMSGLKALSCVYIDSRLNFDFIFYPEEEVVTEQNRNLFMEGEKILERIYFQYRLYRNHLKRKPPADLNFTLNSKSFQSPESIGEKYIFDLLKTQSNVSDIYQNSDLLEWETTEALVELRKKNLIKVSKNKREERTL